MVCSHYKLYMKAKKGKLSPRQRHDVDTTFYTRLAELQVRKRQRDSGVGIQQDDDPVDDGGEDEDDGSDDDGEGSEDEEDSDGGDKEDPEDSSDAKDSDGSSGDDKASDDDKDESEVGDILVSWMRLTYPANL